MSSYRKPRIRTAALLLLAAVMLPATTPAPAQAPTDLSSPRATFDTFLGAMVEVKKGRADRIDIAIECLDLSSALSTARGQAAKVARDLKTYLDKVELIDVPSLPVEVDGDRWVYRRTRSGEVSLTRTDDGRWLFASETIESLPSLLDSVHDVAFVQGIEGGGGAPRNLADWLRGKLPGALLDRGFVLEHWQWMALIGIVFIGVVIDRLVRLSLGAWILRLLARSARLREKQTDVDFERPVGILFMALFWSLTLPSLDLPLRALAALNFAAQLVMAAAGVWGAYRLVDLLAAHFTALAQRTESRVDDILVPLVRRGLKIVVAAFGLLFIPFALRVLGAGDVKAVMVLGALWGPHTLAPLLVWMFGIGGGLALAWIAIAGGLQDLLRRWAGSLVLSLSNRRLTFIPAAEGSVARRGIPFAVAIGLAVIAQQLWGAPWS